MSYVVQSSVNAIALENHGRVGITFQHKDLAHPNQADAAKKAIAARVLADLKAHDQYKRYIRLADDLEAIETKLDSLGTQASLAALAEQREQLIADGAAGVASALLAVDAQIIDVRRRAADLEEQAEVLRPLVVSAHETVVGIAQRLNDGAAIDVHAELTSEANKVAEQIGKKAGDLVAQLVALREQQTCLRSYRNQNAGKAWAAEALAKS